MSLLTSLVVKAAGAGYADSIISKYDHLSPEQLIDTAAYYAEQRQFDTALVCCNLVINAPEKENDALQQRQKIDALNDAAVIYYYWMSDYVKAYQLLLDARERCEAYPYKEIEFKIEANIGNIYYRLGEYGTAERFYSRALELCTDSMSIMRLYNNLGAAEMEMGQFDSALLHLERSLDISGRLDSLNLYSILLNVASVDRKRGLFDSSLHHFNRALSEARKSDMVEYEAEILSGMGELLLDTGKRDRAEGYITASSDIAKRNNLNNTLLKNHLLLSQIERSRGRTGKALEHMDRYNSLRDSLFSSDKLMNINQLQRLSEVSKTSRQIEKLSLEQHVKERTINYQKVILIVAFVALLLLCAILLFVFRQNGKLNKAYRVLFEKNIEIMKLQDGSSPKNPKNTPRHDNDGELLARILATMEDTDVICNPNFSMNMLSSLVEANHIYVSQVINTTLHKNFRSLLNEYRIREAQRLFSEPDAAKYTIESVSLRLGYKSRNTFSAAFVEITGVSPGFYLKSIRETPDE